MEYSKLCFNLQCLIAFVFILISIQSCGDQFDENFDESNVYNCADIMFEFINNGVKAENKAYINDKLLRGSCFIYDANNSIVELRSYQNGVIGGLQRGYYIGLNKINYEGCIKKGEIHGPYRSYHVNGNLASEGQFNKGFYSGRWTYYDENKKIIMNKIYAKRNGRLIDSTSVN